MISWPVWVTLNNDGYELIKINENKKLVHKTRLIKYYYGWGSKNVETLDES